MALLLGTCSSLLGTSSSLLGTCPALLGTHYYQTPLHSNQGQVLLLGTHFLLGIG